MTLRHFGDTGTALIDFTDKAIAETKDNSENIYLDVDEHGNIVSMMSEHAKEYGALDEPNCRGS